MPTHSLLETTLHAVTPVDSQARARAEQRQSRLTKPAGSLGLLETVGNQLAAIQDNPRPALPSRGVLGVFAADHGVYAQGVSPWPQEISAQQLVNMCHGGTGVNALAGETGTQVWPIDIGIASDVPDAPGLRRHRVRSGTMDMTQGPAMTRDEAQRAVEVGIALANEAVDGGADILLTGELGICNTTAAAAVIAAITGKEAHQTTGRGAGSPDDMLARKVEVVAQALAVNSPNPDDPLDVLSKVGGLELAGMAGFMIGGAARAVPVVIDGVISCASALIAVGLAPHASDYLIAGHTGCEPGIQVALTHLEKEPLVDLGMRLGEGSGALVALSVIRCGARVLRDMSTFESSGVSGRIDA